MALGAVIVSGRLQRLFRPFLALVTALALSACSTAEYAQPVSDFAGATRDAEAALVALNEEVTQAYAASIRRRALSGDGLVKFRTGDCLMGSERCRLVVIGRDGRETTLAPEPTLQRTILLMRGINGYAQGLAAIVAADTAHAIAAHVDDTVATVDNLADTVGALGTPGGRPPVDTSPYTTAAGGLISWAAGRYVDRRKVAALRRATVDSKAVIAQAAGLFSQAAEIAAVVPRRPLAEIVAQRIDAFDDARTAANLDHLIESATAYDKLLTARPPRLFRRLAAAHTALVNKLQGADVSLVLVIARINAFQEDARMLAGLLRGLPGRDREPPGDVGG